MLLGGDPSLDEVLELVAALYSRRLLERAAAADRSVRAA